MNPRIDPKHRGRNRYDDTLETGMVLCIESMSEQWVNPTVSSSNSRCL